MRLRSSSTAALIQSAPARANIVFDFKGVCDSGCTGTATGVLTLANSYTFGSDLTLASFVSFHYSSSDISFDVPGPDDLLFSGGLNADGSIVGPDLAIIAEQEFGVFPGGKFLVDVTDAGGDMGSTSAFTLVSGAVPEPSTWAMMLLGFAGSAMLVIAKRSRPPSPAPDTSKWPEPKLRLGRQQFHVNAPVSH